MTTTMIDNRITDADDVETMLRERLKRLEAEIAKVRRSLAAYTGEEPEAVTPETKYQGRRHKLNMIRFLQSRNNEPITYDDLYAELKGGGSFAGRKDPEGQMKRALKAWLNNNSIVRTKDGRYKLPE